MSGFWYSGSDEAVRAIAVASRARQSARHWLALVAVAFCFVSWIGAPNVLARDEGGGAAAEDAKREATPAARQAHKRALARRPRRAQPCRFQRRARAVVTAVLTATTFRIDDGTVVRLQSLLAPDATDAPGANGNWPMAQAATAAVRARLLNRRVLIRYRRGRPDRYGRRLAHAWVIGGTRAPTWLQADLLKSGLARFAPDRERATCASRMQRAEAAARRRARGLWALSTYATRPALKPFDLVKRASTFQIVEGRVAKASDVRGRVYLNFGRSWRRDFTVSISRRQMRFFARGRIKPLLLAGQRIRVRGWIVVRNGPMIEIDHTHQIEVLRDRRSPGSQAPHSQAPRSQSPRSKSVARRSEKSPSGREPGKRIRRSPDDHHAPGDPPKKSPVRRSEPGLIDL